MAKSTSILFKETPGSHDVVLAEITCDNSYPSGGYPVAALDLKGGRIKALGIVGVSDGFSARFDAAAQTIVMITTKTPGTAYPNAGNELDATSDLTGVRVTVLAFVE